MISTDYLVVCVFKKVPIFAYNIVTNGDTTVYNALGYRVWKCSDTDTLKVDPLYKLGYYCSISNMKSEDINNLLPVLISDFAEYQDTYVKLTGKVTKVSDNHSIIMATYTEDDNGITYDDSTKINVNFNIPSKSISDLNANETITIAGKVDKLTTEDGNNIIRLIDSSIVSSVEVDNSAYNFSVDDNIYCKYDKELWFETSDNIYYKSCINDLNITLNNNQYNLMNAIKNNNITLKDLESEASGYLTNSKDSSIIYTYDNFKLLICDSSNSKDVIIGRTSMSFSDGYCQNLESTEAGV